MASTTTVHRLYGRWRDQAALSLPDQLLPVTIHTYDAPSPLPARIRLGDRVQVIAVSPMAYRTLHVPPGRTIFDVYDPQIVGVVEGVRTSGAEKVTLLVRNERAEHGVAWAVVSGPPMPGDTPSAVEDGYLVEWMKSVLDGEGSVVALRCADAEVVDHLGGGVTLPVQCQYPDPEMRRRDRRTTEFRACLDL
ncbi:hypothetical protein C8T65DRAFT_648821 [Cerioporus squamosus]|nr:hypothetical protein C8T65DRAFT_648821 [Cerioporus squamosus]